MAHPLFSAKSIHGAVVASAPQLGQDLLAITKSEHTVNLGQVISAGYEEGGGHGFIIKTTEVDGETYVRLQRSELAIPLRWRS